MTAEDDMKRVTKSRANELNHAKCILKLTYTKFEWSDHELLNYDTSTSSLIYGGLALAVPL